MILYSRRPKRMSDNVIPFLVTHAHVTSICTVCPLSYESRVYAAVSQMRSKVSFASPANAVLLLNMALIK